MFSPVVDTVIMASCVGTIFAVEIGIFGFKTFKWVFSHVPVIGGKG